MGNMDYMGNMTIWEIGCLLRSSPNEWYRGLHSRISLKTHTNVHK
jgi:hypothetical protein